MYIFHVSILLCTPTQCNWMNTLWRQARLPQFNPMYFTRNCHHNCIFYLSFNRKGNKAEVTIMYKYRNKLLLLLLLSFRKSLYFSGGSTIYLRRGRQLPGGAPIYHFANCMKSKEFGCQCIIIPDLFKFLSDFTTLALFATFELHQLDISFSRN